MKTVNKKEIQSSVKEALTQVIGSFEISKPSKKTEKLIEKASKKLSRELKGELKKQTRKMLKAGKAIEKEKVNHTTVAA